jgi:hypothetical protein
MNETSVIVDEKIMQFEYCDGENCYFVKMSKVDRSLFWDCPIKELFEEL